MAGTLRGQSSSMHRQVESGNGEEASGADGARASAAEINQQSRSRERKRLDWFSVQPQRGKRGRGRGRGRRAERALHSSCGRRPSVRARHVRTRGVAFCLVSGRCTSAGSKQRKQRPAPVVAAASVVPPASVVAPASGPSGCASGSSSASSGAAVNAPHRRAQHPPASASTSQHQPTRPARTAAALEPMALAGAISSTCKAAMADSSSARAAPDSLARPIYDDRARLSRRARTARRVLGRQHHTPAASSRHHQWHYAPAAHQQLRRQASKPLAQSPSRPSASGPSSTGCGLLARTSQLAGAMSPAGSPRPLLRAGRLL